jgi:hypothetical protein
MIGFIHTFFTISLNDNQLKQLTINDCLRLPPFWPDYDCLLFTGWLSAVNWLGSDSESYVTTDGQSTSPSWNKAPIWGLRPDFYYCQTVADCVMWGGLSDEKTGLSFTIATGPRQRSHSRVRVPEDSWLYFTVSDSRLPFFHLLWLAGLRWTSSTPPPNGIWLTDCQSQSYVTTGGQSASLSWNKAPIWGLRPDLYYCQTVAGFLMARFLSVRLLK